ncbi:MAG: hypothetical protein KUG56_08905 [Kordiimonadaceae bacterium]|nr:hypothetical protein [Kordiimonadaceae bacterium]
MANLPEFLESLRQSILGSDKAKTLSETAANAYSSTVGGLKGYGGDALDKTAANFNDALPYIERAGFLVTEIEVGIGISPKIVPHLRMSKAISAREREALLEEVKEKRLVHTILTSLFSATAARKRLNFKKYHFTEIELELSVLPSVTLKFKPNETIATTEIGEALLKDTQPLGTDDTDTENQES